MTVHVAWQDQEHTTESPDRLPAYWPASLPAISTDSPPPDSQSQSLEVPLHTSLSGNVKRDSLPAKGLEAGKKLTSAGRQRLKTYAELLAEETAAMKNAVGPWQQPTEKSSKLMVSVRCLVFSASCYLALCKAFTVVRAG